MKRRRPLTKMTVTTDWEEKEKPKETDRRSGLFSCMQKNPTLGVGFEEAYSYAKDIETPFAIMPLRSANCKEAKGGH